jgi:hypothetical protein
LITTRSDGVLYSKDSILQTLSLLEFLHTSTNIVLSTPDFQIAGLKQ